MGVNIVGIVNQMRDNEIFYEIGPLLLIEWLLRNGDSSASIAANQVLQMKKSGEVIPMSLRFELLDYALAIDNDSFIKGFEELKSMRF